MGSASTIINVRGYIDKRSAETILSRLEQLIEQEHLPVCLDFQGVEVFLQSAADVFYREIPPLIKGKPPGIFLEIRGLSSAVAVQMQLAGFSVNQKSLYFDSGILPGTATTNGIPCPACESALDFPSSGFFRCPVCRAPLYYESIGKRVSMYETLHSAFDDMPEDEIEVGG